MQPRKPSKQAFKGHVKKKKLFKWLGRGLLWGGLPITLMGGNPGKAGCGDLLHNYEGEWFGGFVSGVGFSTSCVAELWVLHDGLNLASSLQIENLIVELDALAIVHLLRNSDCRNLLRTFPRTQIEHVFREANQCVDALTKLGAKFSTMYVSFVIPPAVVVNLLALDRVTTSCNRLISIFG